MLSGDSTDHLILEVAKREIGVELDAFNAMLDRVEPKEPGETTLTGWPSVPGPDGDDDTCLSDMAMDIILTEHGYAGLCVGLAVGMLLAPTAFDGVELRRISDGKRKGNRR
jgi:hypothetical protein